MPACMCGAALTPFCQLLWHRATPIGVCKLFESLTMISSTLCPVRLYVKRVGWRVMRGADKSVCSQTALIFRC